MFFDVFTVSLVSSLCKRTVIVFIVSKHCTTHNYNLLANSVLILYIGWSLLSSVDIDDCEKLTVDVVSNFRRFHQFFASTHPVDGVGGILFSGCSSIFAYVCRHSLHMMEAFYNWLIWSYLKTIIWKQSFIWFMHAVFAMDSINKHFVAAVLMKSLHNRYFIWETASKCACTGFPKKCSYFP